MILKFKSGLPRYSLAGDWETVPDDAVCRRLAAFDFNPEKKALIAPNTVKNLPAPSGKQGSASASSRIDVVEYRPWKVELKASAEVPSILLDIDKYEPGWTVCVDGNKADLLRCDFVCQGVYLSAGEHKVVFQYGGGGIGLLWIQFAGMAICLGAAVSLVVSAGRKDYPEKQAGDGRGFSAGVASDS